MDLLWVVSPWYSSQPLGGVWWQRHMSAQRPEASPDIDSHRGSRTTFAWTHWPCVCPTPGGRSSAGQACRQGPGQQPQNSEKCSLSPPREPCSQHSPSRSSGFRGQRTWESLQGGFPRLVLKTVTQSSQDGCLRIPWALKGTQPNGQDSIASKPGQLHSSPTYGSGNATGLCFLFHQMKTIGPTQQVVMRIKWDKCTGMEST